jgi:hypothetical protein
MIPINPKITKANKAIKTPIIIPVFGEESFFNSFSKKSAQYLSCF